jgi:hypothetical protein
MGVGRNFPAAVTIFGRLIMIIKKKRSMQGIFKDRMILLLLLNRQLRFFVKARTGARRWEEPTGLTNGEYPILSGTLQTQCSV